MATICEAAWFSVYVGILPLRLMLVIRQTLGLGKVGAVIAVIKEFTADKLVTDYLRLSAASAAAFSTARAPLRMWLIA